MLSDLKTKLRNFEYDDGLRLVSTILEKYRNDPSNLIVLETLFIKYEILYEQKKTVYLIDQIDIFINQLKKITPDVQKGISIFSINITDDKVNLEEKWKINELKLKTLILKSIIYFEIDEPNAAYDFFDVFLKGCKVFF